MRNDKLRVCILPFGGKENPYQELTRQALLDKGLSVSTYPKSNFLPLLRASRSNCDILHLDWAHSFYSGSNYHRALLKWLLYRLDLNLRKKTPIVWTLHNERSHNPLSPFEDKAIEKLIENVSGVVYLSESSKSNLTKSWPLLKSKPNVTIPHGNYIDWYPNTTARDTARTFLGISARQKVALFIGRIQPYKGIEELIVSFKSLHGDDYVLVIAGNPTTQEYQTSILESAKNDPRIKTILTFIPEEDLQLYFNAADFCVLPFKKILNSGSAVLSMSFSTPIIAPRVGSLAETIPTKGGILYNPTTSKLKDNLEIGFNMSHEQTAQMGKACFNKVDSDHGWAVVSERLASFYKSLVR
ncbi:glycosyltransferase family 4 protein [Puniceicoccaceae bacterium K14]|nr:glycosyltransferase family 4 protein [Puniceicoccaceae bacterium K14]